MLRWVLWLYCVFFQYIYAESSSLVIEKNVVNVSTLLKGYFDVSITQSDASKIDNLFLKDFSVATGYSLTSHTLEPLSKKNGEILTADSLQCDYIVSKDKGKLLLVVNVKNIKSATSFSKSYTVNESSRYPFLVHKAVADISRFLGLPPPSWMEKFIILSKYQGAKEADLYLCDYTLSYQVPIIKGGMSIFPKWENSEQKVVYYTRYEEGIFKLYRHNIYTAERQVILQSQGMLICTDISKDGKKLLVTMAPQGQPDIYLFDRTKDKLDKLTTFYGIDIAGGFLNDDNIAFISERLGTPAIYSASLKQVSMALPLNLRGKNQTAFATSSRYIAYITQEKGSSSLHLALNNGELVKTFSRGANNLFPRISSTEDALMYVRHTNKLSALVITKIATGEEFMFDTKGLKIQSLDW